MKHWVSTTYVLKNVGYLTTHVPLTVLFDHYSILGHLLLNQNELKISKFINISDKS